METFKICSKCKIEKSTINFNKCKSKKDGLYNSCKQCRKKFEIANRESILKKKKEYRDANKEEINKKTNELYHKNKDRYNIAKKIYYEKNIEEIKQYHKKYYQDNKDKINPINKKYYEDNKEKMLLFNKINYEKNKKYILERNAKYQENNKCKINKYKKEWTSSKDGKISKKVSNHTRNTKIRITNDNTINKKSLKDLLIKQDNKCYYCKSELDFNIKFGVHLDHYIPIAKGGPHSIENVVFSCKTCNLKKRDIVPVGPLET